MKAAWLYVLGLVACGGDGGLATERDCIASIASAPTFGGKGALVLIETCPPRIEVVVQGSDGLATISAAGLPQLTRAPRVLDLDARDPVDTASVFESGLGYVEWRAGASSSPRSIAYARPITDVAAANIDDDDFRDIVVAGDGAVRVLRGALVPPMEVAAADEIEIMRGKPFTSIAVLRRLGRPAIAYVADAELGIAGASDSDVLVYEPVHTTSIPSGPTLPIIAADVDDDNFDDAITATTSILVYSSRHDRVLVLDEQPLAIAAGDIDGDGDSEAVFLSGDGRRIARVRIAPDGGLGAETVIDTEASALAIPDLDNDGRGEIVVVEGGLGTAGTRVVVH